MQLFKVNDNIVIVCDWKKTRNGFKHEASLMVNGSEVEKAKSCYLNRTWERFEYQSVMHKLVSESKYLTAEQKKEAIDKLKLEN